MPDIMPLSRKLKSSIYQILIEYGVLEMGAEVPPQIEEAIDDLVFISKELAK